MHVEEGSVERLRHSRDELYGLLEKVVDAGPWRGIPADSPADLAEALAEHTLLTGQMLLEDDEYKIGRLAHAVATIEECVDELDEADPDVATFLEKVQERSRDISFRPEPYEGIIETILHDLRQQ